MPFLLNTHHRHRHHHLERSLRLDHHEQEKKQLIFITDITLIPTQPPQNKGGKNTDRAPYKKKMVFLFIIQYTIMFYLLFGI